MTRRSALAAGASALAAAAGAPAFGQGDPMAALAAAAKPEGSVIVDGPPNDAVREAITKGFQAAYGIPVSYISSGSSQSGARVRAERAAGKYALDVFISGPDTPIFTFLPSGWLDPVGPILVSPDVLDKRKWTDGHIWYEDDKNVILRVIRTVVPELAINTTLVKKGEVTTWKSLLDPKWQGKIIAKDPAISGAGASIIAYFYLLFGPDFVKRLYKDQKPFISRDARQASQLLAQGEYAIQIGPDPSDTQRFKRLAYPVQTVFPTDGPPVLSGGFGMVCLMNKAPHPNAAKLFINWFAGREAQEAYANASVSASLRTDITYHDVPPYIVPKPGVKYLDTYDYKFVMQERDSALEKARALLGT